MKMIGYEYIGGQPPNPRPRRKPPTASSKLRISDVFLYIFLMQIWSILDIITGTKKETPHCDREATGDGCFFGWGLIAPCFLYNILTTKV
jgi:hypothetical protein